jgi:hypothetical protein
MKQFKHSCTFLLVLFLFCNFHAFATDSDRLSVDILINKTNFNGQSQLTSQLGYGFGVSYRYKRLNTGMFFQTGDSELKFDYLGDVSSQYLNTHILLFKAGYQALKLPANLNIEINAGVGIVIFETKERQMYMGALGEITIPQKKDTDNLFVLGAGISKPISSKLSLILSPEMFFIDSFGQFSGNFNFSGGISFVIY